MSQESWRRRFVGRIREEGDEEFASPREMEGLL